MASKNARKKLKVDPKADKGTDSDADKEEETMYMFNMFLNPDFLPYYADSYDDDSSDPSENFSNSVELIKKYIADDVEKNDPYYRHFSVAPNFDLLMFTNMQLKALKKLSMASSDLVVHLDRTGGSGNGRKKPANFYDSVNDRELFLYSFFAQMDPKISSSSKGVRTVHFMELLTSRQHGEGLAEMFNKFKQIYMEFGVKKQPFKCIITDYCSDQINAILSCFNDEMRFPAYLKACHDHITKPGSAGNKNHVSNNMVLIRLCLPYLMRMMKNDVNVNFKGPEQEHIRDDITKVIAQFFKTESYMDTLRLAEEFFKFLILNYDNVDEKDFVTNDNILNFEQTEKKFGRLHGWNRKDEILHTTVEMVESKFYADFYSVYEQVVKKLQITPDAHVDRFIIVFIKKYLAILPLWTEIMTQNLHPNVKIGDLCGDGQKFITNARTGFGLMFRQRPIKFHEYAKKTRNTVWMDAFHVKNHTKIE